MFVPHRDEHEFLLKAEGDDSVVCADGELEDHRGPAAETLEGIAFVKAALAHSYFKPKPGAMHEGRPQTSVEVLVGAIKLDLKLRGISRGRRFTFSVRIYAIAALLKQTGKPEEGKLPAAAWTSDAQKSLPESGRHSNRR